MRDFSVELIWAKIQAACAVIGGWLGFFLGGMDGMLIALIVFMALDYVTGKQILALLQKTCRDRGMTVIVITHNLALTPMADKVIHIRNGKVEKTEINDRPLPVEKIEL